MSRRPSSEITYWRDTLRQRRMIIIHNSKQGWHGCKLVVRWLSFEQLNDRTTKTPNIRSRRGSGKLNDLWSHPVGGSNNLCLFVATSQGACRNTKVCQFNLTVLGRQNVGALDIPMDDTLIVEVKETLENLCHVYTDEVFWELAKVLADRVQRAILAVSVHRVRCYQ